MGSAEIISRIDQLPRLPKAISDLLDAVNDDNVEMELLAKKVSCDALISAKVLRMANSARFGRSREIGSIDEAVIRLGQQPVKILVTASAISSSIKVPAGVNPIEFWGRSFEVAFFAQELAKRAKLRADTGFTCGLLHNVGELLLALMEPAKWQQVQAAVAQGADLRQLCLHLIGTEPAEVAATLAAEWRFSDELVEGLRYQNNPVLAEKRSPYGKIVFLAKLIIDNWPAGPEQERTSWLAQIFDEYGLRLQLDGLALKLESLVGSGEEMAQQLG
ncbi:HDOD domain-containing protein [Shewanella avicenniae]|uniref:HDOD domain-containing protein n=1 Tax=Shewanella avicenniae TaxID=2814294 RepID=A0ABX7QT58_9GAMM|nr:HDOD domain-containing protein [Shewanella avicenniae]QSX33875.1 HDOD domain-containing protein [Shewanella avicenniae]